MKISIRHAAYDHDIQDELGPRNHYDHIAAEALSAGHQTAKFYLIDDATKLGEMLRTIPFDNDKFYTVVSFARELEANTKKELEAFRSKKINIKGDDGLFIFSKSREMFDEISETTQKVCIVEVGSSRAHTTLPREAVDYGISQIGNISHKMVLSDYHYYTVGGENTDLVINNHKHSETVSGKPEYGIFAEFWFRDSEDCADFFKKMKVWYEQNHNLKLSKRAEESIDLRTLFPPDVFSGMSTDLTWHFWTYDKNNIHATLGGSVFELRMKNPNQYSLYFSWPKKFNIDKPPLSATYKFDIHITKDQLKSYTKQILETIGLITIEVEKSFEKENSAAQIMFPKFLFNGWAHIYYEPNSNKISASTIYKGKSLRENDFSVATLSIKVLPEDIVTQVEWPLEFGDFGTNAPIIQTKRMYAASGKLFSIDKTINRKNFSDIQILKNLIKELGRKAQQQVIGERPNETGKTLRLSKRAGLLEVPENFFNSTLEKVLEMYHGILLSYYNPIITPEQIEGVIKDIDSQISVIDEAIKTNTPPQMLKVIDPKFANDVVIYSKEIAKITPDGDEWTFSIHNDKQNFPTLSELLHYIRDFIINIKENMRLYKLDKESVVESNLVLNEIKKHASRPLKIPTGIIVPIPIKEYESMFNLDGLDKFFEGHPLKLAIRFEHKSGKSRANFNIERVPTIKIFMSPKSRDFPYVTQKPSNMFEYKGSIRELYTSLKHEMRHLTQILMKDLFESQGVKKNIRTFDKYSPKTHGLIDAEFETDVADAVQIFKSFNFPESLKPYAVRVFMGLGGATTPQHTKTQLGDFTFPVSPFFIDLQQDKPKLNHAIKKFVKEVL